MSDAAKEQPDPLPGAGDCWFDVIADMHERRRHGLEKYGVPVRAGNGRDAVLDAYQEVLDNAVYLRQLRQELQDLGRDIAALLVEVTRRARSLQNEFVEAAEAEVGELLSNLCADASATLARKYPFLRSGLAPETEPTPAPPAPAPAPAPAATIRQRVAALTPDETTHYLHRGLTLALSLLDLVPEAKRRPLLDLLADAPVGAAPGRAAERSPGKYGSLDAFAGKLRPGEPWFAIRAQDRLAVPAIHGYAELLRSHGLPGQAQEIEAFLVLVRAWQGANPTKLPD